LKIDEKQSAVDQITDLTVNVGDSEITVESHLQPNKTGKTNTFERGSEEVTVELYQKYGKIFYYIEALA